MNCGRSFKKTAVSDEDAKHGYGQTWIWVALDPVSKLIISYFVGDRTLDDCNSLIKDLVSRLECKPLFTSDELRHYQVSLLEAYHSVITPELKSGIGRPYNPRKIVHPDLDYAVVHKTRINNRVVKVEVRVIYGIVDRIESRLASSGSQNVNTSYIERVNGTLRQHDSNLRRKS